MTMRTRSGPLSVRMLAAATASTLVGGLLAAVLLTAPPAAAATFSNPATITLPDPDCTDPDAAIPYPSNISVAGLAGTVTDVNVTLNGVTHPFEGDLEILLVGPGGGAQNIVILSDAGTGALSNATVTFDDAAASQAPQNSAWGPGTYKPTNYTELGPADGFPAPAPAPSGNATLSTAFNGITPNGTWSLYIVDDACPDAGTIAGGWTLDITTASSAATSTSVTSSLNPSRTGQSVTFTAMVTSSGSPVTTGTVTFTEGATTLAANVPVNGIGQASFSTSSLTEGNHIVTATYNGTASFATSSGQVNQRVDNDTVVTGNTYCNTGPLTLPANGVATPYPSNIFVASGPATLGKVVITLKNVTHPFDGDIEALLVGPGGQNLVVVSDAGTAAISNVSVTFDDAAAGSLPAAGSWAAPNSTITARPTNYSELTPDDYPPPAPAPSAATALATFNGTNANGTWSLYVIDDAAPDGGSIAGGWCLTLTAPLASPTISTQASAGGAVGTSVTDTATVAGGNNPTGTVTFRLFSDAACTSQVFTSTNALGGGIATSGTFTPAANGTYFWTAVYNGDASNNTATSPCGAPQESVVIGKAQPAISTTASPGNFVGAPVRDTATVAGGDSPTGTVTFRLFSDATCTTQVFISTTPLVGGTATSGDFTPAAAGTYIWTAVYNGDTLNETATSPCGAPNESVVIQPFEPPPCTLSLTGDVTGPVVVNSGQSVCLNKARVTGPVWVNPGGALTVNSSQITQGIVANGPSFFSVCGSQVTPPRGFPSQGIVVVNAAVPLRIGDPANGCAGNRVAGDISLTGNTAGLTLGANVGSRHMTVDNNTVGLVVVKANIAFGTLACSGNAPPPSNAGQPNTAVSKTGQCAAL